LSETDNSIGGTALLGLVRLSRQIPDRFDQTRIAKATLRMAGDKSAGELSRITALQVCARLQIKEALPLAWQAAQKSEPVTVRISAINALGSLADGKARPFLNDLLAGNELRLRAPAQTALTQIERREPQPE